MTEPCGVRPSTATAMSDGEMLAGIGSSTDCVRSTAGSHCRVAPVGSSVILLGVYAGV